MNLTSMEERNYIYRENRKIKKLAREYKQKGYKVIIEPSKKLLPPLVWQYTPDILLKKDNENILVEVKTTESIRESAYLKDLAEKVNSLKNWKLELVLTNPRTKQTEKKNGFEEHSINELEEKLENLKLTNYKLVTPHFLYAWSLFEASARHILKKEQAKIKLNPSASVTIKQLYSYGIIEYKTYEWLNYLREISNQFSHGYKAKELSNKELEKLVKVIEGFIESSN